MNIKRRLQNLECRPSRRPVVKTDPVKDRELQRKLALPLPTETTPTERAHALELFRSARDRLRIDFGDTGGCDAVRDYALSLHTKYGTDPTWGD